MSNGKHSQITVLSRVMFVSVALMVGLAGNLWPQDAGSPDLSLKSIYTDKAFSLASYGPARFLEDGRGYTTLEKSVSGAGKDIVQYDSESGQREILISAEKLIPAGKDGPLEIRDYIWSDDGEKVIIFTNTRKVWRRHTRGDYWVLDLKTWELRQLGKTMEPATMMFAKFSPDGRKVGFVNKQNIFVEDMESGDIQQVTFDGGDNIINGTFDWVYEEELEIRDGFRWSPDSKNIAYWQLDTEGIGTFYLINNIDSIYSQPIPLPYPKVGTTNPAARIGVLPADGGQTRWFDIPGDPRNHYLARMDFTGNSDEVIIQQLNRLQNANKVMLVNIHTGAIQTVFTERDEAWVEVVNDLKFTQNGKYFTWLSERDGWKQLYAISRDGDENYCITNGEFDVIEISNIDEESGYVYYLASPDNPTKKYLYRSKFDGTGRAEKVTPEEQTGHHGYQLSPDSRWAIHTYENNITPNRIDFISLPDHKSRRMLEDNAELAAKISRLDLNPKEFFRVTVDDGTELDAWMIKPVNFDPGKQYPVIFFVYGEPAGSTVQDNWKGGELFHHYMAQQGYLVMSVDNRGTRAPRGREWRKSIYRQIGILASFDQKAAAEAIIQRFDFVDPDRIGMHGWSGGGSMTLNCMFRFPDIYKTGVAIAFISDQKIYDTIYQERFMGLPVDNANGYREGSPITHARNLQGNLLLVHGSGDDNCHYQSCELLINELVKHNKMFSMMEYPMRTHGINERENTSRHLRETMVRFFLKNLEPGPKE
jgi:dipeptidyl-peptidase 4